MQEKILVVDDEPQNLKVIQQILGGGYKLTFSTDGEKALSLAEKHQPSLVLLDVMMPAMNGFEVCQALKSKEATKDIPVVFVTAMDNSEDVKKGLGVGGYYYLTKPVDKATLKAVVVSAMGEFSAYQKLKKEIKTQQNAFSLLAKGTFHFRTIEEGERLALMLAKACPEPEKQLVGLNELFINAVEHGNLGITYDQKTVLHQKGIWAKEIVRLAAEKENLNKSVRVTFERENEAVNIFIEDEGKGFDWKNYLSFDPERLFETHGRGIAMANELSFDHLEYQGKGNQVLVKAGH